MKSSQRRCVWYWTGCALLATGVVWPAGLAAAETTSALSTAIEAITTDSARHYVTTLADDTFEGRAAGSRGGRAAGLFIVKELQRLKLRGAGDNGGYYQRFGAGLSNILAVCEGGDPELKRQYVVVGAHYDHVGYGNARNSFGPTGYIHNGADDNASGVAGLLEVAAAFSRLSQPPKRSVIFAFWDGEEAGLLGSKHWVDQPTVPLAAVVASVNIDMIGRLRAGRVEVYGVRSSRGYRRLVSEQNTGVDLSLDFNLEMKPNSDHYSFLSHRTPTLFFHTGLHDDYHRPSDDADKINADGVRQTATLIFKSAFELADRSRLEGYRDGAIGESSAALQSLTAALPPLPPRLGVGWDEHSGGAGLPLTRVDPRSPAARAGLRAGDRVLTAAGRPIATGEDLRRIVMAAENPLWLTVQRAGAEQPLSLTAPLAGSPYRVGFGWRADEAEPDSVIVSRVMPGSPAWAAGLRVGERIYRVNGESITGSDDCSRRLNSADGLIELEVEAGGRTRRVEVTPLERIPSEAPAGDEPPTTAGSPGSS